jgi:Fuc2NAc and GlcNAc transferase
VTTVWFAALLLTLAASVLFCWAYLRLALRWRILAMPNERSSHRLPTPHGGGAPMLLAFTLGLLVAALWVAPWAAPYSLLAGLALALMLLGIADDVWSLPVSVRLGAYGLSCLVATLCLLPPQVAGGALLYGILALATALAMLWLVNLYNFMDGIDGIAASQCLLAAVAAALLSLHSGAGDYPLFCLLLAASQLGFLVWNWPPARLFMGDAGSVPTGFLLAGLALLGSVEGRLGISCWLVLLAIFITDASWTLLWRIATGQPFTRAHRLHAYQRLSVRWGSHLRVDLLLGAIFCGWLLPLAWLVQSHPNYAVFLVILAYLPLLAGMAKTRPVT